MTACEKAMRQGMLGMVMKGKEASVAGEELAKGRVKGDEV